MIASVFHTVVYVPLYNGLVFLIDKMPTHDVGMALIALTLIVKFVLFPLSLRVANTQEETRRITPELNEIKKKYKGDRPGEAKATMDLYREHNIHPLSGVLLLIIQLPILLGLYFVFARGGLPDVHVEYLYSFIQPPPSVDMFFFGGLNIAAHGSVVLALMAGVTQYIYALLAMPSMPSDGTFQSDIMRSMSMNMKYVLPVIIAVISYSLAAAVPLYWITSNIFMIVQELVVRKTIKNKVAA